MVGIYFSGTGNTKHCIEKLLSLLDPAAPAIPMEQEQAVEKITAHKFIVLAYPVQYSNAPLMVRDFIRKHADSWNGKQVLCMATMGLFSGDGTGCTARILKKYGATIVGGLHIRMPDSIGDVKLLKKTLSENRKIVEEADKKLEKSAKAIQNGRYPKEGLGFFYHMAGLFGQRIWFYQKTQHYSSELTIHDSCVGCGICEKVCPMHNIVIQNGKPQTQNQCTMCYRCISLCPQKSITLIGKEVKAQCRFEKYIKP